MQITIDNATSNLVGKRLWHVGKIYCKDFCRDDKYYIELPKEYISINRVLITSYDYIIESKSIGNINKRYEKVLGYKFVKYTFPDIGALRNFSVNNDVLFDNLKEAKEYYNKVKEKI
jgi:hypothetical protein